MLERLKLKNLKPETVGKTLIILIVLRLVHDFLLHGTGFISSVVFPIWSPPIKFLYPSTISIKMDTCHVLIPVEINNKKGMFLFDPSSSHSKIDRKFAQGSISSIGIPGFFGFSFLDQIKIGEMTYKDIRLPVSNIDQMGLSDRIDGILGVDFMIHTRLTINSKNSEVTFNIPRSKLNYVPDGKTKISFSFQKLAPLTETFFGGTEFIPFIPVMK